MGGTGPAHFGEPVRSCQRRLPLAQLQGLQWQGLQWQGLQVQGLQMQPWGREQQHVVWVMEPPMGLGLIRGMAPVS
jgi:hypothetical protein